MSLPRPQRLVDELVEIGELRSTEWTAAFQQVPRHPFVPRFYERNDDSWIVIDSERAHDEWFAAIYADRVLVTRVDDDGRPVSSSSMPHMMARFLELLGVQDGNTVLEIGTGTGYNAALLSERLGSQKVASIDIDPSLVSAAKVALTSCGYSPELAVADGHVGYPRRAPYDRIIATCSVPRIPEAWLDQLGTGGAIVAPMAGGHFEVGLVRLEARRDGSFQGRFHPHGAVFMQMAGGHRDVASWNELFDLTYSGEGNVRECRIPRWLSGGPDVVDAISSEHGLEPNFLLRLEVPELHWFWFDNRTGTGKVPALASAVDRSWARVSVADDDTATAAQGGPQRLWDVVEQSYELFTRLGEPDMGRYGMTITPDRRQLVWLDSPDSKHRWELSAMTVGE